MPEPSKLAMKPYYYLKEGIFGRIYLEKLGGGFAYEDSNYGNGLLGDCLFEDVNHVPLSDPHKRLINFDYAIVIPPYFYTEPVSDSLRWSGFE